MHAHVCVCVCVCMCGWAVVVFCVFMCVERRGKGAGSLQEQWHAHPHVMIRPHFLPISISFESFFFLLMNLHEFTDRSCPSRKNTQTHQCFEMGFLALADEGFDALASVRGC